MRPIVIAICVAIAAAAALAMPVSANHSDPCKDPLTLHCFPPDCEDHTRPECSRCTVGNESMCSACVSFLYPEDLGYSCTH